MTDNIKIKIRDDGAAETAKQLDKIVATLERQQKVEAQIAKTSSDIARRNKIDAIRAEAAALNQLDAASTKIAAVQTQLGSAVEKTGAQFGNFRSATGASAALVGNLGRSFSLLVPAAAGMTGALQTGGMAMSQFLGVLGGGPGILLGGAVAAIGLVASYMANAKTEADELAKSTEANAKAMGTYLDQIGKLRASVGAAQAQRRDETALRSKLIVNQGSTTDYEQEIGTQQARLDNPYYRNMYISQANNPEGLAKRQSEAAGIKNYIEQLRAGQRYAQEQAAAAAQQVGDKKTAGMDFDVAGTPGGGGKAAPSGFGAVDPDAVQARIDKLKSMETQYSMDQRAMAWETRDLEIQATHDAKWEKIGALEELNQANELSNRKAMEASTKTAKQSGDSWRAMGKIGQEAAGMFAGASLKAFSEIAKGKKVETGAVMEALGDQLVASGTGHILQGIAISANPWAVGSGSGMIAAGGVEVAFGMGLGAVGARGAGGSNSGGGDKAKPGGGFDDRSPYRDSFTPAEGQGPTVINITMPTVTSPTAEDGIRIREALGRANLVYGKGT